jgi:hypothetical protein
MFVLEGVDEINRVIEANKSRKLQKKKKLSNNTVITIENIYPRKLQSLSESIREDLLKSFIADSGYCSEKNLLYLKERGIDSFIQSQMYLVMTE